MGQYECHVFVCTSGETCPTQGDTERFVKILRDGARQAGKQSAVRVNKAGCFSQCGHGPMIVIYPDDVWYGGVQESDLEEILTSHILGGRPLERLRYRPGVRGANKMSDEEGIHDGSTLTCMEHMWQFDLKTGAPLGDAQEGLKEYRLKEEHGDLYIALEG